MLAATTLFLAACSPAEKPAAPPAAAAPAAPGTKLVQITGDDTMKFNLAVIEVKAGEPLRLVFSNIGKLPKQAMAHNWVLLKPCSEADFNAFGTAAAMAPPTHIPAGKTAQIVAQSRLLGPGETETLDFKAPEQPGEYPYLCTFPGHFALMRGKMIVK